MLHMPGSCSGLAPPICRSPGREGCGGMGQPTPPRRLLSPPGCATSSHRLLMHGRVSDGWGGGGWRGRERLPGWPEPCRAVCQPGLGAGERWSRGRVCGGALGSEVSPPTEPRGRRQPRPRSGRAWKGSPTEPVGWAQRGTHRPSRAGGASGVPVGAGESQDAVTREPVR